MKNDNTQQTIKKTKTKENRRKGDIYEIKKNIQNTYNGEEKMWNIWDKK